MPDFGLGMTPEIREKIQSIQDQMTRYEPEIATVRNYNLADYTYEVIMEQIKDFEDALDDDQEVALKLTSFGQSITMAVTGIGYANPSTLFFYGLVGDQEATLIQHVSQLNFLLLAVKKTDPEKPARRIGFVPPSED